MVDRISRALVKRDKAWRNESFFDKASGSAGGFVLVAGLRAVAGLAGGCLTGFLTGILTGVFTIDGPAAMTFAKPCLRK